MSSQLQNIMDLQPRKYNWIEDNEEGYGFVAQEVHSVFPQLRDKFEETYCADNPDFQSDCPCDASGKMFYYGLDYSSFVPYLVKGFQEYISKTDLKISELESLIATNKTSIDISINSLESQIAIADISINNLQTQNSLFTEHTAITDVSINTLNSQVIVNKNLLLTLIDDNS